MIDGVIFSKKVREYYSFLVAEFDFDIIEEKITGNFFYKLRYSNKIKTVSISYENAEEYFQTVIFVLKDGMLPDYNDQTRILYPSKINQVVFSTIGESEIESNNKYFLRFSPVDKIDRMLLKSAKELRLYLKHNNA